MKQRIEYKTIKDYILEADWTVTQLQEATNKHLATIGGLENFGHKIVKEKDHFTYTMWNGLRRGLLATLQNRDEEAQRKIIEAKLATDFPDLTAVALPSH